MITLTDLCEELRNWNFNISLPDVPKYRGTFTISDGEIDLSAMAASGDLQSGQYFRIIGSHFNDGVHQYPATGLVDETFDGSIWAMSVPVAVTALLNDINTWLAKYVDDPDSPANSPYSSESFGGYSYTKSSGNAASGGAQADLGTWQNQFRSRLSRWRKTP